MQTLYNILGGAALILLLVRACLDYQSKKKLADQQHENSSDLEELKAKLTGTVFLSNLQYEKEFKIYHELFRCITQCVRSAKSLMPRLDNTIENSGKQVEEYQARYERFVVAYNALVDVEMSNSPFYDKKIGEKVKELIVVCSSHGETFKLSEIEKRKLSDEMKDRQFENNGSINDLYENIISETRIYLQKILVKN